MTLKASLVAGDEPEAWEQAIQHTVHDVFCSREWCLAASEIDVGRPGLVVIREGDFHMAVPTILRDFGSSVQDAISPYGYAGPVFSAHAHARFRERALCAASQLLADLGAVTWFVRCNPILDATPTPDPPELVYHGPTVSVDLSGDRDTRWSLMNSGHRYEIRRALREGLVVVDTTTEEDWSQFRGMYESTMRKLNSRPYYLFSDAHWAHVAQMRSQGWAKLLITRIGSDMAGGAMFLCKPHTSVVHYHLSGTSETYRRLNPSKVLIATAEDLFADAGFKQLHLGGGVGAREDSLYAFKRGFSQTTHPFHSRRLILDPDRYRQLCSSRPYTAGGHFPEYRA